MGRCIMITLIFICLAAYLLGSVNTSILISHMYGTDIRTHGSGNAGATNTLRVLGKKAAAFVVLGDVAKGVLAVALGGFLMKLSANLGIRVYQNSELYCCAAGFFAILGHNFPLYFKGKGGKGILTSAAVIAVLQPVVFVCLIGLFLIVVLVTRYVSLGSVCAAAVLILLPWFYPGTEHLPFLVFGICAGGLAIFMHRGNLKRLAQGTEPKLGEKKHGKDGVENG